MEIKDKIKEAREARGLSQEGLARAVGISQAAIKKIEDGSTVRSRYLPDIAKFLGIPLEETALQSVQTQQSVVIQKESPTASAPFPIPPISNRRIPVYGTAIGGDDGAFQMNNQVIDYVFCPPGLENVPNVYAVYVQGDSMEPAFTAGQLVWLHPSRPVRPDDDVVVQIKPYEHEPPMAFIKRYVRKTADFLVVKQFNPPRDIEYDIDQVVSCHRIVFAER